MAEGFQVPLCECGHTTGAHKSGGRGLVRMGRGVCLMPDCDCREYREPLKKPELNTKVIATEKACAVCGRRIAPGSYYVPDPEPRHLGCGQDRQGWIESVTVD